MHQQWVLAHHSRSADTRELSEPWWFQADLATSSIFLFELRRREHRLFTLDFTTIALFEPEKTGE